MDIPGVQEGESYQAYSADQLDNLLGPIALYPDPLLAQVLLAATFVDQVDQAARFVRANGTNAVDDQAWDVSVRAVAHYPTVISMMADQMDWTTALGQAYANQSTDVMMSVQRLRAMANAQGNLVSTPQQQVVYQDGFYDIWPAQAQYIFVPTYDPSVIFFRPAYFGGGFGSFYSFSSGFFIGSWLNHDFDWRGRRIFYTGWNGGGWIVRSRPFLRIDPRYVDERYRNIVIDRGIINRRFNAGSIDRFRGIHPNATFDNRRGGGPVNPNARVNNKIIDRNINRNDPNLDRNRGRDNQPQPTPQANIRRFPTTTPSQPQATHGLRTGQGNFDPRASSQRGQASRAEMQRSAPSRSTPTRSAPSRSSAPARSSSGGKHP
jgi:hypothetical protein